jgi:ribosomal protein S18 acetylase RimI-like enzyme
MTAEASIIQSPSASSDPHLRTFDVTRDLKPVADLIEECFADTMGADGQRFLRSMRSVASNPRFLRWAVSVSDYISFPLTGFVWEEDGKIVGNISMIPYNDRGERIYLLANVAVQQDYRRRGIARALTENALELTRQHRSISSTWLQVRDDNQAAVNLYRSVGFREQARRTTWLSRQDFWPTQTVPRVKIVKRRASDWSLQKKWLNQLYPLELTWNLQIDLRVLQPGLIGRLKRLFSGEQITQWAALRETGLAGVLSWQPSLNVPDYLWLAAPPGEEDLAIRALLGGVRHMLPGRRRFSLDLPAETGKRELEAAGFVSDQTLIWMKLKP